MAEPNVSPPFTYDEANYLNDILLTWVIPLVRYYKSNPASFTNVIKLPNRLNYEEDFVKVQRAWEEELKSESPNIFNPLWKVLKREYIFGVLPFFISQNLLVISSWLMLHIIKYINNQDTTENIIGYVIVYGFLLQFHSFAMNNSQLRIGIFIAKLKGILSELIYAKTLKMHHAELNQGNQSGKMTSIITADLEFMEGIIVINFFVGTPTFFIGAGVLLGFNLGVAGVLGLILAIFHIPFFISFGKLMGKYRYATALIGDSRMKMITNLIEGIRIVKLYGWEHPYLDGLFAKRNQEMAVLKKKALVNSFNRSFNYGCQGLVIFFTFAVYVGLGNKIEPATAFSSIVLLVSSCGMVSMIGTAGVMQIFMLIASLKRITQSLLLREKPKQEFEPTNDKYSLKVKGCSFMWREPDLKKNEGQSEMQEIVEKKKIFSLDELSFRMKPGQLLIVIGAVGSGKTALFMGLLNEIFLAEGTVKLNGKVALAGEEPWVVSGTIRENILMGLPKDDEWYDEVIKACCLDKDLEMFNIYRDETVVGDRGITLSGGQKARVSLARAVYANRDIILLDDPLSAVDPEVCFKLFNECIRGILADKTVILATHQAHFVSQADKILILDEGKQVFLGTYEELVAQNLTSYLGKISQTKSEKKNEKEEKTEKEEKIEKVEGVKDKQSIVAEESAQGHVPFKFYLKYLNLGFRNPIFIFISILIQAAAQVSILAIIYWVILWSTSSDQNASRNFVGMAVLVIILYILSCLKIITLFFPILESSQQLHNLALKGITYTNSLFFDQNPTGRMLNRFSKDTTQMDEILLMYYGDFTNAFMTVLANFIVIIIIDPWILIALAVMIIYFAFFITYFTKPNKDLKRLELVSKSFIVSALNTSVNGLSTIRCLDLQEKLIKEKEQMFC